MRGRVVLGGFVGCGIALAIACGGTDDSPPATPSDAGADGTASGPLGDGEAPPPFAGDAGCSCKDPKCGCVSIPDGWLAVAKLSERDGNGQDVTDGGAIEACPAYWQEKRALRRNPSPASSACSCNCGIRNGNPCLTGKDLNNMRFNDPGADACGGPLFDLPNVGECTRLPTGVTVASNRTVGKGPTSVSPVQVDCSVTATKAPIEDQGQVSVCTSPPPIACADGMCVKTPVEQAPICFLHEGSVACPWQAPARRVLTPEDGITDNRQCSCRCRTNASACDPPSVRFYTNATCTGGYRSLKIDGECNTLTGSGSATHYQVIANPNDSTTCVADNPSPTATGTLDYAQQTLCCPR